MPQSKSKEDVAKYLVNLLERSRQDRKARKLDDNWKQNLDWLKGLQQIGRGSESGGWKSDYVTNIIFSQEMTIVPILASRMARITVHPIAESEETTRQAKEITSLINRILMRNEYIYRQVERVTNMLNFGKGYIKPIWDQRMFGNRGDIRIEVPDTRSIFLEPGKMRLRDMNYVFEARSIDKLTLYNMYPSQKDKIERLFRKGAAPTTTPPDSYGENTGEVGLHTVAAGEAAATTSQAYAFDMSMKINKDKDCIELVEGWMHDESAVEEVEGEKKKKQKKKEEDREGDNSPQAQYPTGRLVTFSGSTSFDDRPNPFPQFPYIETFNYYIPGEPYGLDELSQVKSLQEQLNIRTNQLADGLNFTNFPLIFVDHTAGIDLDEIENRPGGIYPCADVNGIRVVNIDSPTQGAFNSIIHILQMFETVTGVREVTQGAVPGDVRSGFAIEQLQESAQSRLRLKTRNIEAADRELARYLTYMIGAFYIRGTHYSNDIDLEGVTPDMFEYDVKAGVNLPVSRMAEQQMYQWAYSQGIVDDKFIVENFDFPEAESLIQRMQPFWDQKKQLLLAAAQGPPVA